MTLLVMGHAKDCILALSDRMESVAQSDPNEVTKCHLGDTGEYYIALAGDGEMARGILDGPGVRQPSGGNVFREIDRLAAELFARRPEGQVAGHLILPDGGEFKVYAISIASGILVYVQNYDPIHVEGDIGAAAIYKNLARDLHLADMSCETAARCMHAMVSRIAETVESVGEYDRYGIDVVAFTAAGAAMQLRRRMDRMGHIRIQFEPSGTGPLFGPDGGA